MNPLRTIFSRFASRIALPLVLAAIFISGCRSMDKPASASFASVVIYNQTPDAIRQAADQVFANAGYQSIKLADGSQVYEREATKGEQIAYAGFAGAHEGEKTIVRVRMGLQPQGKAWLLYCNAAVVTNPGDFVSEETSQLFGWQSGPYQDLLNNIRNNLKVAAAKAAGN